jgi:hypothetical protein
MPVSPSVCMEKLGIQRIFMKFDVWVFLDNFRANPSVIKIWQEYWLLSMKINIHFSYSPIYS